MGDSLPKLFARWLSGAFRKKLGSGIGAPLLNALTTLDLRIRDNAVNFYAADTSVLRVADKRIRVHRKFLEGCDLAGATKKDYVELPFDAATVERLLPQLPSIVRNAGQYAGKEGLHEDALVKANLGEGAVVMLDRQIQKPGDAMQSRLDIVAVTAPPSPMLVAIELKQGLDPRIQDVPKQLHRYVEMLDPEGTGLSKEFARAYATACLQLVALRRPAPPPGLIKAGMPVRGLLVLADYNPKSELLSRARECARGLARPLFFLETVDCQRPLPPPSEWKLLA